MYNYHGLLASILREVHFTYRCFLASGLKMGIFGEERLAGFEVKKKNVHYRCSICRELVINIIF